jgi:hypothetical protein
MFNAPTNFAFAEWVLSLVMPRERAAAIVGDLAESALAPVAVWLAVLRAFFGSLFQQLLTPAQMVSVAGDMVWITLSLTLRYAVPFLFPILILYVVVDAVPRLAPLGGLAGLFGAIMAIAITLVVPWKTGRIVAERNPGRELPAFVAMCAAGLALMATVEAVGAPWNSILWQPPLVLLGWERIPPPWNPVLMLISIILTRRRWLRAEGPPAST